MWRCFVRDQARVPSVAGAVAPFFVTGTVFLNVPYVWCYTVHETCTPLDNTGLRSRNYKDKHGPCTHRKITYSAKYMYNGRADCSA